MNTNETTIYEDKYWVSEFRILPELVDYLRYGNNGSDTIRIREFEEWSSFWQNQG